MLNFTTEARIYVGEPGTTAVDGYAGFQLGQRYELMYCCRPDGTVILHLTSPPHDKSYSMLFVSKEHFERWWRK